MWREIWVREDVQAEQGIDVGLRENNTLLFRTWSLPCAEGGEEPRFPMCFSLKLDNVKLLKVKVPRRSQVQLYQGRRPETRQTPA